MLNIGFDVPCEPKKYFLNMSEVSMCVNVVCLCGDKASPKTNGPICFMYTEPAFVARIDERRINL